MERRHTVAGVELLLLFLAVGLWWGVEETEKQIPEKTSKTIFDVIEVANVPIHFFGKIMDQDGQSVSGVLVQYNYSIEYGNMMGIAWGQQKITKGETVSDEVGSFSITGIKGHYLTVESLKKEGYLYRSKESRVYNFYGDSSSGKFRSNRNNPVVFALINKKTSEPLISYGGIFGTAFRVPGDGTPARWNLWEGRPDSNGDLQITFKRDPAVLVQVGAPKTWSAKIEVIGGGIVATSSEEPIYRAPENGYVSTIDYPKLEQKQGVGARLFYIKTSDEKYGLLQLEIYPGDDGPTTRCLIKAYMNPKVGSRNLEYDPVKAIKP
jgi:hypothetical protein